MFTGFQNKGYTPVKLFVLFLVLFAASIFFAQFIIAVVFTLFTSLDMKLLSRIIMDPEAFPEYKIHLLAVQGLSTSISMVLLPAFFLHYFIKNASLGWKPFPNEVTVLSTILLVILSMPSIAFVADWNNQLIFPEFLHFFEQWAREKENQLKVLTDYLTNFSAHGEFVIGLIVIALLPAIGEELMFRGVIQHLLIKALKNIHIAIIITGLLFSAVHFQFFGFIPRALLGIMFGYFMHWTRSIWIPVIAHFTNNAFTLTLLYLKQLGLLKIDVEKTDSMPTQMVLISLGIFSLLLWMFYRHLTLQARTHSNSATQSFNYEKDADLF